jgi:DNA-binding transcriptional regulator/RsmH inhibitor MraZ
MLTGTYIYEMGSQGDVTIPRPLRMSLGSSFFLIPAPRHCLLAVPKESLNSVRRNLAWRSSEITLPAPVECSCDSTTGLLCVPEALRRYAELDPGDEAVVWGDGGLVRVARRDHWEALQK